MRDSGIKWIGKIPNSWKVERLQWHLDEVKESNDPIMTTQILSLTNKLGVILYEEKGEQGNKAKEKLDDYKLAYPNTIVANSMNILIGSVGKCDYFGCVSPVYYVFKPRFGENIDFYNYIFQTSQFQKELRKYANGILEIRLRVSANNILKRKVAVPVLDIQNKIVDFLNSKCNEIDDLIALENLQIDKLKEYKQTIINDTVIKGLNKKTKFIECKDSWIKEMPCDWQLVPIKSLFTTGKGLPITKENLIENGVRVISYGQIHAKYNKIVTINDDMYRFVSDKYLISNPDCLVEKGDFIFADTSEDVTGSGDFVYIDNDNVIFAGYHCLVLKAKNKNNNKYLAYLFMSQLWKNQIQSKVTGVKLFSISKTILLSTTILLPPTDIQKEIVKYLDQKIIEIDELINVKQNKIKKLNEYKKSVIYEYVTGKKEVV